MLPAVRKWKSSKHFALQIGAAEIIRIGIVYVGIEIGDLIRDKRRENIQNCLCSVLILHGGQHQPLIQHSAIEQRLAEKGLPEHLLHREERRQEKLNRPAAKTTKPHRKKKKKQVFEPLLEQNDDFFFIAGYTSGGAPYGVTWEEMGLEPWEELI